MLNFGIIALHESRPKVIIRFNLMNIRNNLRKSWTQLLEGETLDLFLMVYMGQWKQISWMFGKVYVKNQS